eukprot:TRINITY_DN8968_c0_g1_i1.p1 TRINITY_DN8968_c0_g1~~TRINITY_DN8968_c0_g1_i1.p1  ORF type:complete len:174 (+),score=41.25 TRINITY_DN8968_c0_g1_i1:439-960(+)
MAKFCTPKALKGLLFLLASALAVYIVGPPLFWQFREGLKLIKHSASCPPCECDCSSDGSAFTIPPGLNNLTFSDCGNNDPVIQEEISKNMTDLLTEELRLHRTVADENQQHAEMALLDAKRLASQYQKEAEKCNAGMETCEGARERAEKLLNEEKKLSALWEQRARQMGWKDA